MHSLLKSRICNIHVKVFGQDSLSGLIECAFNPNRSCSHECIYFDVHQSNLPPSVVWIHIQAGLCYYSWLAEHFLRYSCLCPILLPDLSNKPWEPVVDFLMDLNSYFFLIWVTNLKNQWLVLMDLNSQKNVLAVFTSSTVLVSPAYTPGRHGTTNTYSFVYSVASN